MVASLLRPVSDLSIRACDNSNDVNRNGKQAMSTYVTQVLQNKKKSKVALIVVSNGGWCLLTPVVK
jgi:hypothetical protein